MYTAEQQIEDIQKYKERLRTFTKGCRIDMHEPDEQDVTARVIGRYLDNAMGESDTGNEIVVILSRGKKEHRVNLATLIAMARI